MIFEQIFCISRGVALLRIDRDTTDEVAIFGQPRSGDVDMLFKERLIAGINVIGCRG